MHCVQFSIGGTKWKPAIIKTKWQMTKKKDNTICQNFHIRMVKLYWSALGYTIYMNNTNTIFYKLHLMVFKDLTTNIST